MKITVPPPIKFKDKTVSFQEYVVDNVLHDARFGQNFLTLACAWEILTGCQAKTPEIEISSTTSKILTDIINEPHILTPNGMVKGYNPGSAVYFMPFLLAIINSK